LLRNVQLQDAGIYVCDVGGVKKKIMLKIHGKHYCILLCCPFHELASSKC